MLSSWSAANEPSSQVTGTEAHVIAVAVILLVLLVAEFAEQRSAPNNNNNHVKSNLESIVTLLSLLASRSQLLIPKTSGFQKNKNIGQLGIIRRRHHIYNENTLKHKDGSRRHRK